ncbi:MAG: glycosyltransferase [Patescibacteria group bacterium]
MPKKITILHILPNLSRGGAERVCVDILKNLDQEKFSPVLLLFKKNREGKEMGAELVAAGVPIFSLSKRILIDPINFGKIIALIKKIKPDIIHTHLGGDIYGRLAGKILHVPIIVSTEHNLNKNEKKSATYLKRITTKWANKIFAVSESVREDAIIRYQLNPEKITVLYNGIDTNFFRPEDNQNQFQNKDNSHKLVLGALGRLSAQKGFMSLIEAISKTKNKNYSLEIGGVGELENDFKKRIKELELINRVSLLGLVDTKKFLNKIDIFIFPSLWEGLGLAILEAGAMNKPIIASQIEGVREVLDEDNAFLFPAGDDDILAEKIDFVINNLNSSDVKRRVEIVQKIIREKFSVDDMVIKYANWYESLFNKEA